MKKLPVKLKRKLIQINNTARKVDELADEFNNMLQSEYGLDLELFYDKTDDIAPLISICNSGDIYDDKQLKKDIEEIERIFLANINKKEVK